MSQPNLAIQPPDEEPHLSQAQPKAGQLAGNASTRIVPKLGQQRKRSPAQQAEVDRIKNIKPYVGLLRDEELFTVLNKWWETGICGCVTSMDRLGLKKALEFYEKNHVKKRGDLLMTPAPVARIEVEQNGSPTDLFLSILKFLVNPIDSGNLRQLRSRTLGTLTTCGVKLLLVDDANQLSFKAFYELLRITENLEISIVLAGTSDIYEIIDPRIQKKRHYLPIHNAFLKQHVYNKLDRASAATIIAEWEKRLGWSKPLNLTSDRSNYRDFIPVFLRTASCAL